MKTRIIVHIALSAKGERVGSAVEVAGRLIPFGGLIDGEWRHRPTNTWIKDEYYCIESVECWKKYEKTYGAVRFQRVILEGESK